MARVTLLGAGRTRGAGRAFQGGEAAEMKALLQVGRGAKRARAAPFRGSRRQYEARDAPAHCNLHGRATCGRSAGARPSTRPALPPPCPLYLCSACSVWWATTGRCSSAAATSTSSHHSTGARPRAALVPSTWRAFASLGLGWAGGGDAVARAHCVYAVVHPPSSTTPPIPQPPPCRYLIQLLPAAVVAPLFFQGKVEFGVITQSQSGAGDAPGGRGVCFSTIREAGRAFRALILTAPLAAALARAA